MSQSRTLAVGVGVLLVLGGVGGATVGVAASDGVRTDVVDDSAEVRQTGAQKPISPNETVRLLQTVANQTNGTVVGTQLKREDESGVENGTLVYEVDVLQTNGTHLEVDVSVADGRVLEVEAEEENQEFFDTIFDKEDEVPENRPDLSAIRPATAAIHIAVNETRSDEATENRTVTEVELEYQNDTLVYEVELEDADGERRDVVVHAKKGQGGVITTEPQEGDDKS